jgi:hypothetical protein
MTFRKIAIIRQDNHLSCPFGLPISEACKYAGESIQYMTPLDEVEKDDRERFANANKKVYVHRNTGERCPYADKIAEGAPVVHCDFEEGGEGLSDSPMRPSPYYPRVFNGLANNAGGGIAGLVAHPIHSYWDNMEAQQLFASMLTMFARESMDDVKITKVAADLFEELLEKGRGGQ